MQNKIFSLAICMVMLTFGTSAYAVSITVDVISADWTDVILIGSGVADFINTDGIVGNEEIRWGNPVLPNIEKSGYRFDSAAPAAFSVDDGTSFSLGDFTHFNFPVLDPWLESTILNITADITIDSTQISEGPFTFSFLHNETSNHCSPLPACANDIVSFSNLATSDTFTVNGQLLTLELLGFQQGSLFTEVFSTAEDEASTAQLVAIFQAPTTQPVPEPSTMLLLGSGLMGLVGFRRKC